MPGPGRFSPKEDRQIAHIKASGVKRGMPPEKAEGMAYGTVVNQEKKQKASRWHSRKKRY